MTDTPKAFANLYDTYAMPILRYCQVRIADPTEAEDAAALVFARAFAAYPPENPAKVRSWLFAIAHNVVANHYRQTSTRMRTSTLDDAQAAPDPAATPYEQIVQREERAALLNAIEELTTDQRRVIELRLSGLTGPEIADVLGRSHASIKMLQYRAISHLRNVLVLAEEDSIVTKGARAEENEHGF